jgi:diguanylate cyclase (GGDEF)-like protein
VDARTRVMIRAATGGLAAVLVGLTAAAIWQQAYVDRALRSAQRASHERDLWQRVSGQVREVRLLGDLYLAGPTPTLRSALSNANRAIDYGLASLIRDEQGGDAAAAARARTEHAAATDALERMLAARDAGDLAAASGLRDRRVQPVYRALEARTGAIAGAETDETAKTTAALRGRQHLMLLVTVAVAGAGLVVVAGFLLLLLGYERKLVRQAATSRHQALHDGLTGLPNRALFADRIGQAIRIADRELRPAALLLLDLDRFKDVNDTLGHHHGDLLLIEVAERLRRGLRHVDTVARLGGDEFAALLPDTGVEGAVSVAGKLRTALQEPLTLEGIALDLDASIGITIYPDHGNDAAELLQHADVAMYGAKHTHAGFLVYDPAVDQHSPRRLALLGGLRQALERDELVLHYQPKAQLRSGRILGVEALARWQHPEHGLIGPEEFIRLAERTGLIYPLTRYILRAGLRQAARWHRAGLPLSVAVNISTRCLLDPDFPEQVNELLVSEGVPPELLVLEITESAVMADPARALDALDRLHTSGVGLSIDDFGTGYSSMSYLKALPVDELKIDRSFVMQMATSPSDAVIVHSTIDLGHNLGLRVVAEGVEDQAAQERLTVLGCDTAQGYHLARPMPPDDLEAWLRSVHLVAPSSRGRGE